MSDKLVIVVDDSKIDALRAMKLSESLGVKPFHIINPLDAAEIIAEKQPNLVIMDVEMPEQDGYRTTSQLLSNEATQNIPVAILTSKQGDFERMYSEMVGAVHYLPKPLSLGLLKLLYIKVGIIEE
mgnify:CR=1 FL=1